MLNKLLNIAAKPQDAPDERYRKRIAIALTLVICGAGLGWAATYYLAGLRLAAAPPAAYVVVSLLNIGALVALRKYEFFLFVQTALIALLPFAMHEIMGGFEPGSAVILWSILAPVSLLYIKSMREATPWFFVFAALVVAAGVQELMRATLDFGQIPSEAFKGVFFMFNIIGVGGIAVFSIAYFVNQTRQLQEALKATVDELEDSNKELISRDELLRQNLEELKATQENLQHSNKELLHANKEIADNQRQLALAEKMSALGQLVAGVAHEVNTPLGAINASVGSIRRSLQTTDQKQKQLAPEMADTAKIEAYYAFLAEADAQKQELSSREKRKKRRELAAELEEMKAPEPEEIADLLVDLGFKEIPPSAAALLATPGGAGFLELANEVEKQRFNIRNIETAVERASKIVFALKNYSRQSSSGEFEETDIPETLDTVLTIYHNQMKNGVEVNTTYEEGLPLAPCQADAITQVWTNILHNALQAMNYAGALDVAARRDGGYIRVEIADSGPGIPEDVQPRIFEPFFSTKKSGEGSGLGLDIVKKIVDQHQGEITFESEPGRTTFIVKLPLERKTPETDALESATA